jgi:hypothetical protein
VEHDVASFSREGPAVSSGESVAAKSLFSRSSMGRQLDEKLGYKAERERDYQQHAETGEYLQRLGRVHSIPIVSVEGAFWRIFVSLRGHAVP